jgi:hypothetical protein
MFGVPGSECQTFDVVQTMGGIGNVYQWKQGLGRVMARDLLEAWGCRVVGQGLGHERLAGGWLVEAQVAGHGFGSGGSARNNVYCDVGVGGAWGSVVGELWLEW